jgi:SAM-dependent methyltransferase
MNKDAYMNGSGFMKTSNVTQNSTTPPDFWDKEYETLDDIWGELHRIQTDFCFGMELGCYYSSPLWHAAKTVIDLGSGIGYYLGRLSSVFSNKHYTGIDINGVFVEHAKSGNHNPNVHFECSDLFNFEGKFDFLLIRLVFQHLSNPETAIDKIADLLKPGGGAFIVDALDPYRFYYPEPSEYVRFFKAFEQHQLSYGFDRDIAGRLPKLIEEHPRLQLKEIQKLLIPSTISNNLSLFEQTYYLVIQLLQKDGKMQYDFNRVKKAWREWCRLPKKYMQVGLRYISLSRIV